MEKQHLKHVLGSQCPICLEPNTLGHGSVVPLAMFFTMSAQTIVTLVEIENIGMEISSDCICTKCLLCQKMREALTTYKGNIEISGYIRVCWAIFWILIVSRYFDNVDL